MLWFITVGYLEEKEQNVEENEENEECDEN